MKTTVHLLATTLFVLICLNGTGAQELAHADREHNSISKKNGSSTTPSSALIPPAQVGQFVAANLQYPENSKIQGIEGQVLARVTIASDGKVQAVQIVRGLETSCDRAVEVLFMNAPGFVPFTENGVTINKSMLVPVNFRLR